MKKSEFKEQVVLAQIRQGVFQQTSLKPKDVVEKADKTVEAMLLSGHVFDQE